MASPSANALNYFYFSVIKFTGDRGTLPDLVSVIITLTIFSFCPKSNTEVAKVNEIWHEPEDQEGVKGWLPDNGYYRDEVHAKLKNVAEFARNAADIFEAETKANE